VRRVVLDSGVLVSALITPSGVSGQILGEIREGAAELIASSLLLEELERVLRRDKFRRYLDLAAVEEYVDRLRIDATVATDPRDLPRLRSADPKDDYLIALAKSQNAVLVSGDSHLLDLRGDGAPILAPSELLSAVS
jgi:putative PIN family toxin of toxin-antitoxin system